MMRSDRALGHLLPACGRLRSSPPWSPRSRRSVMAWRGKPMYAIVIAGLASQWAALLVLAVYLSPEPCARRPRPSDECGGT